MGGQGDILSGVIATFLAWGKGYEDGVWKYVNNRCAPIDTVLDFCSILFVDIQDL